MGRAVTRRVTAVEAFEEVKPTLTPGAAKGKAIAALTLKAEAEAASAQFGTLKKELLDYMGVANEVEEDDKGHRYMRFANAITTGGKKWAGIKREKRTTTAIDLDKAEVLLKEKEVEGEDGEKHPLWDDVAVEHTSLSISRERVEVLHQAGLLTDEEYETAVTTVDFDPDDLYVLNQQEVITDEELDDLFVKTTTYAFVPFKEA